MNLAIICTVIGMVIAWLFPTPLPVLAQSQTLRIISTGAKDVAALGQVIEVRRSSDLVGNPISFGAFMRSGDWQIARGNLVSEGKAPGSTAEFSGAVLGGIVLRLRYNDNAGKVRVIWGGESAEYNLYSDKGATVDKAFIAPTLSGASVLQQVLTCLAVLSHVFTLASLWFLIGMASRFHWRFAPWILLLLYGIVFYGYLMVKLAYPQFTTERAFRDTVSYVTLAEKPLTSPEFWVGERPFTLPLVYKFLQIDSENYTKKAPQSRVGILQTWLSVIAWSCLGLALARSLSRKWLGPLAFGMVLFFSASLELSLWDRLLLSESISLSLLVLLIAAWIMLETSPASWLAGTRGYILFGFTALFTIFYTVTRDSNVYLVLVGAGVFTARSLMTRGERTRLIYHWAYLGVVVALFSFQNYSMLYGNRWQIHIYDHLALRILPDQQARDYFLKAGLPLDADLQGITKMPGYEYHELLMFDPSMEAVRNWVNQKGWLTFINYLLSKPSISLLEPLRQSGALLNGSNLEYSFPRYPLQPASRLVVGISEKFYPHNVLILFCMLVLVLVGWTGTRVIPGRPQAVWWIVAVLVVSIYPLMVLVWNGNPLEIERHAAQIGIQYRLASWMALVLMIDQLSTTRSDGGFQDA